MDPRSQLTAELVLGGQLPEHEELAVRLDWGARTSMALGVVFLVRGMGQRDEDPDLGSLSVGGLLLGLGFLAMRRASAARQEAQALDAS